jgi:hypothetical protein
MDAKKKLTFADLPLEVREMIWEQAIWNREGLGAAHFFNTSKDGHECHKDVSEDPFSTTWAHTWWDYRSPCWDPSEPQKLRWSSEDNISGYTQNSGLWNACRESRRVLVRHWKTRPQPYLGPGRERLVHVDNFRVENDDGDFFIVTHPKQDLVCVNFASLRDNFVHGRLGPNFTHFGFVFDPDWVQDIKQRSESSDHDYPYLEIHYRQREKPTMVDHFFHQLEEYGESNGQVWLIDYRLKPTAKLRHDKIAEGGKGPFVFRARDRRFIQVLEEDVKPGGVPLSADTDDYWWTSDGDDSSNYELDPMPNSFPFITWYIERYFIALTDMGGFGGGYSPPVIWSPPVGVLGCVMEEDI